MSTALIIVDIQNDYFPNGKMELSNPERQPLMLLKFLNGLDRITKKIFFMSSISQVIQH